MAQEKYEIKIPKLDASVAMEDLRKAVNNAYGLSSLNGVSFDEYHPAPKEEKEEWVWVEGYKGTDRYMRCRDYRFNLHEQFDMPEGEPIVECHSGFHLCPSLSKVFNFYGIEDGNRFFRVKALVRKRDADHLCSMFEPNKLVAKSIIFMSELTTDEIFQNAYTSTGGWTDEDREAAREEGCTTIDRKVKIRTLTSLGYNESVAEYVIQRNRFELAKTLGLQTDISMDTKFICIFNGL